MITPNRIAEVLGGTQVLGRRLGSVSALNEAVSQGLPKAALRQTAVRVYEGKAEQRQLMNRSVPEATFKRRRGRLRAAESERPERSPRVRATGGNVWGRREGARLFVSTPPPPMPGKTP